MHAAPSRSPFTAPVPPGLRIDFGAIERGWLQVFDWFDAHPGRRHYVRPAFPREWIGHDLREPPPPFTCVEICSLAISPPAIVMARRETLPGARRPWIVFRVIEIPRADLDAFRDDLGEVHARAWMNMAEHHPGLQRDEFLERAGRRRVTVLETLKFDPMCRAPAVDR